ncbi:MAG: PRC-barrel domain-containing protein [Promethearchaeota archaeon]
MKKCVNMKSSDLKNKAVFDAQGSKIGRVIDLIFNIEGTKLSPKFIVLGGGRIEEFLESIGAKPDNDPLFTIDVMEAVEDERIVLCADRDMLMNTLDFDVIGENDRKLSDISKASVIDADGIKIGKVVDTWFADNGEVFMLLGGGFWEETLERLGVQPEIDLLVSEKDIESFSEKEIKLKWTKFQLEANCEKEFDKLKRELSSRDKPGDYRFAQLRLGRGPSRGMA